MNISRTDEDGKEKILNYTASNNNSNSQMSTSDLHSYIDQTHSNISLDEKPLVESC